jgi:hypothetical protein
MLDLGLIKNQNFEKSSVGGTRQPLLQKFFGEHKTCEKKIQKAITFERDDIF